MSYIVRSSANMPKPKAWTVNRQAQQNARPKPSTQVTRRFDISWLTPDGDVDSRAAVAPALPMFERAFNAFVQGTLIQTSEGYIAIDDLEPGMMIATADGGTQPLLWIGSMMLYPQSPELGLPTSHLYRLTDGSYGQERSAPDLMLGSAARIMSGMLAIDSSSKLVDVEDAVDGHSVIQIRPMSPLRVFHLALANHRLIRANGVLAETFHPGSEPQMHMSTEMFQHYLSLFPHVRSESDFGPLNHKRNA